MKRGKRPTHRRISKVLVAFGKALLAIVSAIHFPRIARAADASSMAEPRTLPQPDLRYTWEEPRYYPSFAWLATQLIPSPEIGVGKLRRIDAAGVATDETA